MFQDGSSVDDQLLLDQVVNGKDPKAFEILYAKYYPRLHHRVAHRIDSRVDAEDLTQSIFVRLWETRARYRKTKSVEAYLYAVANNAIAQHFRQKKQQRRHVSIDALIESTADSNMQHTDAATGQFCGRHPDGILENKKIRMSQKGREAVRLRFVEGLSTRQAARVAGCSVAAFYSRLERAIKALRQGENAGCVQPEAAAHMRAESPENF